MAHDSLSRAGRVLVLLLASCGDEQDGGTTGSSDGAGGAVSVANGSVVSGSVASGSVASGSNNGGGSEGGGGSDPGTPDLCAEYADVVVFAEIPYNDYSRRTTASVGGFPPDRIFVLPMTLAPTPESYPTLGNTSMAEYQGPPTFRHMTISRSPCDFRPVDPTGASGPLAESAGTATLISWNVGVEPLALVAGETYYFNYRNTNCAQASCDASTSTNWPH